MGLDSLISSQIIEVFESYDLGTVTDVYEIFGGWVNRSFGVYAEKHGAKSKYFVRKYKAGVKEEGILFEHSLIEFSIAHGLYLAASIKHTKDGKFLVQINDSFFAIYEFLQGEDKYTWIDNQWNDAECASAAEVLAAFHNAARNFDAQGLARVEPRIMELLPTLPDIFAEYTKTECPNNRFHDYYLINFDKIIEVIKQTQISPEDLSKMPFNPIHCDFHPGNLKYADNQVVGIFDFDWSKIDLRLFDLGLGLVYCCSFWTKENFGTLSLDKMEVFLKAYQNKLQQLGGLAPLNETEKKYLPELLSAGNIYLLFWCLKTYYGDMSLNVLEYLTYLQHQVKQMNWIEEYRPGILAIVQRI